MMVSNEGNILNLLRWQQGKVAFYAGFAAIVAGLHEAQLFYEWPVNLILPTMPIAVVGGAIGIFVSFRTNAGYDRWWEGRKLWGRLINTSRHWCSQAVSWTKGDVQRELVRRHIAYVHTLRCLLRGQDPLQDHYVMLYLTDHEKSFQGTQSNQTHSLLQFQSDRITELANRGELDERRLEAMDQSIRHLLDIQGGCERIKKTPFPRGYHFITERLVFYYSMLLPFAIVDDLRLLVIPMNVLVCLSFALISEAGRVLETPFSLFWNGLPLFAMSRTIENNLRDRIGETDLEPLPRPDENGILM